MKSYRVPNIPDGDAAEKSGIVFDIQHYAIFDGPGIRTCVFFKGCPLHCAWCHNPESQNPGPELSHHADNCSRCGQCVKHCPNSTLSISKRGWLRSPALCNVCGACAAGCPGGALERIGTTMTSGEVMKSVVEDSVYFAESKGGVTISGGEPTLQKEFLIDILGQCRERGIHTAIETCGFFPADFIPLLAPVTDLFLFDIKHTDEKRHVESTGVSPATILHNFRTIVNDYGPEKTIPRIPLVPGFNTDSGAMVAIATFLHETGYAGNVHLMPYNNLSKHKYEKLGKADRFIDLGTQDESIPERVAELFLARGFGVFCNN